MRSQPNRWRLLAPLFLLAALIAGSAVSGEKEPESPGAWLGVMLGTSRAEPAEGADGSVREGVPVRQIVEGSPAAEAGLRARDRILSVAGTAVHTPQELLAQMRRESPGNWVPVTVARGDRELEIRVRLATRPADTRQTALRRGSVGIKMIDLPPALREHFGAPAEAGAMISAIEEGSPAEAAGFELGDVVFEVEGQPVKSASDLHRFILGGGVGNKLEFTVVRSGSEIVLEAVVEVLASAKDER